MRDILENKLNMYQKVQGFLSNHVADTASIAAIDSLKTDLGTEVANLQQKAITAAANMTGHTVDKQNSRNALKQACLRVSTAIVAHAGLATNNKLLEKYDTPPYKLDEMRDKDFYTYCSTISAEAATIVTDLAAYGVTSIELNELTTAQSNFHAIIQNPRLQINERSQALSDVEAAFVQIDSLLRNKLDKVMMVFMPTNPSLYQAYKEVRAIDDDGRGALTPDYTLSASPNTTALIAEIPYLSSRVFWFSNDGDEVLAFTISTSKEEPNGYPLVVEPSSQNQRITHSFNENESAVYLLVQNNQDRALDYRVWITK